MSVAAAPDSRTTTYQASPSQRVWALFSICCIEPVVQALFKAGFGEEEIFGLCRCGRVRQINFASEHRGLAVRLPRDVDRILRADDIECHAKLDRLLDEGGCVIDVATGGDGEKKHHAAEVFKAAHAEEILYWGRWTVERM